MKTIEPFKVRAMGNNARIFKDITGIESTEREYEYMFYHGNGIFKYSDDIDIFDQSDLDEVELEDIIDAPDNLS